MSTSRFQDKGEFQRRVYEFTVKLLAFIEKLPSTQSCKVIGNQLIRSGTSIGANYFEAQAASSRRDFTNFFHHALKSANESLFWLALLQDTQRSHSSELEYLNQELEQLSRILTRSILTLKGK